MRAYRHTSFAGFDALDLVDEDIPSLSSGQVLVRVRASSLNVRHPVIASRELPLPASHGLIALSDGAVAFPDMTSTAHPPACPKGTPSPFATASQTHSPGPWASFRATGNHVDFTALQLFRVEDEPAVEHREIFDETTLTQQLSGRGPRRFRTIHPTTSERRA